MNVAQIMTRKLTYFIALLVIGGGVLAASIFVPSQNMGSANAEPEIIVVSEEKIIVASEEDEADFLNYDMVMGDQNAPIEIIEYAALSCSHCANFHADVLPALKEKYIDTGKVKLVFRNFIFENPFDVFAASLTRCTTEENFFPTVKAYFDSQNIWRNHQELKRIFAADGREAAMKFARDEVAKVGEKSGISLDDAEKCYDNEGVINYLLQVRQEAVEKYQVNSTPTVIVNGKKIGGHNFEIIERAIAEANKAGGY